MATVVILVFHPQECGDLNIPHGDNPFEGISVLAVEEATGGDYGDIIDPVRAEFPNAKFMIEEN